MPRLFADKNSVRAVHFTIVIEPLMNDAILVKQERIKAKKEAGKKTACKKEKKTAAGDAFLKTLFAP